MIKQHFIHQNKFRNQLRIFFIITLIIVVLPIFSKTTFDIVMKQTLNSVKNYSVFTKNRFICLQMTVLFSLKNIHRFFNLHQNLLTYRYEKILNLSKNDSLFIHYKSVIVKRTISFNLEKNVVFLNITITSSVIEIKQFLKFVTNNSLFNSKKCKC